VDTIVKFSRKHLVLKGQIYPVGVGCKQGVWKATQLGLERVERERGIWSPRYSEYKALLKTDTVDQGEEEVEGGEGDDDDGGDVGS